MTRTVILLNYQVNKDYVANVLCENKEKKELQCEGKCHLKKELQKEEKKESTPSGSHKDKFDTNLFNITTQGTLVFSDTRTKTSCFYLEKNTRNISIPVFHPPGFSA